jgi:hypothetical protein
MAKDEKMNRFNSKIAREAEKNKLIETAKRKVRPPRDKAMTEILQAGDEAYAEVRRETRGAVPKNPFKKGGFIQDQPLKNLAHCVNRLVLKKAKRFPLENSLPQLKSRVRWANVLVWLKL